MIDITTAYPPVEQEVTAMPTVYRRGGRGPWWCAFTGYDGQRRQLGLKVHSHATAKQMATMLEAQHAMVRMGLVQPEALLTAQRGLIDPASLLDEWAETFTGRTGRSRRSRVAAVRTFLADKKVIACSTFATVEICERLKDWIDTDDAAETRKKKLGVVRSFGSWLVANGYSHSNKADSIRGPQRDGVRRIVHRALMPAEVDPLWSGERGLYYRFRCMTGVRGTEAVKLLRSDLDLSDRPSLLVRREVAKNGLEVTVPIATSLAEVMAEAVGMAHPGARLFPEVPTSESAREKRSTRDFKAAGFGKDVNERTLRMTFTSWLIASGADLLDIARLRRDRNPESRPEQGGKGSAPSSANLIAWNYADHKVIGPRLRGVLTRFEQWIRSEKKGSKQA